MASVGQDLKQAMSEALAHAQGVRDDLIVHDFKPVNIKAIRERMNVTQEVMAAFLGVSVSGYRKWEQGQRDPNGAAKTLLRVMDKEPQAVLRALSVGGYGSE